MLNRKIDRLPGDTDMLDNIDMPGDTSGNSDMPGDTDTPGDTDRPGDMSGRGWSRKIRIGT